MSVAVGQTLGAKYRLVERIGAGGMGEVWLAHQSDLDREVALKLISIRDDDVALRRFEREARLAAKLQSPHVASVFDFGTHDGSPFLVMERLIGEDLHARLERGPLSVEQTAELVTGVAEAIEEAHQHGIIHRDIKPPNIFFAQVGGREIVKVLDFGIATKGDATRPLTGEGTIIGTPQYMSPEQSQGEPVDHRSDLWSLAVVAYEALIGANPFEGKTDWESLAAIVRRPVPPPSEKRADLSPAVAEALDAFFHRALRRDPAARHQTAARLGAAYAAAARGEAMEVIDTGADTKPMQLSDEPRDPTRSAPQTDVVAVQSRPALGATPRRAAPWVIAALAASVAAWMGFVRTDPALRANAGLHLAVTRLHMATMQPHASDAGQTPVSSASSAALDAPPGPSSSAVASAAAASSSAVAVKSRPRAVPDALPAPPQPAAPQPAAKPPPTAAPTAPSPAPPAQPPGNEFGI